MKKYLDRDGEGVKGTITLKNYILECPRAVEIDEILRSAVGIAPQVYKSLVSELESLCRVTQHVFTNRVVLQARTMQAGRLIGDTTYTGIVSHGALGDDDTAVTDTDTSLGNEVARKSVASVSQTDDTVSIDFYYSKSDTNGTYEEFALYIDGTATLDSGLMFNRALTGGWTKTNLESMTVSIQVNINPV